MATEVALGCWKVTLPSLDMLKLFQLSTAFCEVWLTVSELPVATAVATPEVTKVAGLPDPQEFTTQGTGSWAAIAARASASETPAAMRLRGGTLTGLAGFPEVRGNFLE